MPEQPEESEHPELPAWSPARTDPVLGAEPAAGSPGMQPSGADLDLRLGWERFEQLVHAVARDIDGLREISFRRYGTPGQAQHGIDIVGRRPDGRFVCLQCKQYQSFTARDLTNAVTTFAAGTRPFGATEFIAAVSSPARRTEITDELERLRGEHPDLTLELYDSEKINDLLRIRADIVARFWTRETADTFCTGAPLPGVAATPPDRIAQAQQILRGPVKAIGLEDELADAEAAQDSQPSIAAAGYAAVANMLDAEGYAGHALLMRRRQLDALLRAGHAADAAELSATLAVHALSVGNLHEAQLLAHDLDKIAAAVDATAESKAHARLVGAGLELLQDPLGRTTNLEQILRETMLSPTSVSDSTDAAGDEISPRHTSDEDTAFVPPYTSLLVLLLGENMLTVDPERLASIAALLDAALVDAVPGRETVLTVRIKLLQGAYDSTVALSLLSQARRHELAPKLVALIWARHARLCTITNRPEEGWDAWRDAIAQGVHHGLVTDAAGWLYSLRLLNIKYGRWTGDLNEEHRLAEALTATGSGSLLPRSMSDRERALAAIAGGRDREAVLCLRQYRLSSVVLGHLADELEAVERLGEAYARTGVFDLASSCFQQCGSVEKLKSLAQNAGELLLPIGPLRQAPFWTLEARTSLLAEQADLIDDPNAANLLDEVTVLAKAVRSGEVTDDPRRSLYLQACRAACVLAARGTLEQAKQVLDLLEPHVARKKNHGDGNDDWHADACLTIAQHHSTLRQAALMRLMDLAAAEANRALSLLVNADFQSLVRGADTPGETTNRSEGANETALVSRLAEIAAAGMWMAQLALAEIDPDRPDVAAYAIAARDQILKRPDPVLKTASFGTGFLISCGLVTALGAEDRKRCIDKFLSVATDRNEPAVNRQEALTAMRRLSSELPEPIREQVFATAQQFASGEHDGSAYDELTGAAHPLSAIRISLGSASLRGDGVMLAAAVAATTDEYSRVYEQVLDLLGSSDTNDVDSAALAATWLPADLVVLDVHTLSTHPTVALRHVAAVLWARNPSALDDVGARLASDPHPEVRRVLANLLEQTNHHDGPAVAAIKSVRDVLKADRRHSVRRLVPPGR